MTSLRLLVGVTIGLGMAATAGLAEDDMPAWIGRLSAVVGGVDVHARGDDWSPALVNEPVADGTALRSASAGRAALSLAGWRVALAPSGELRIARFDPKLLQVVLAQGRIGIHLGAAEAARTVEIDLRQGGVWLDAPGDYDIAAGGEHAPARIAVFAGSARFAGGGTHTGIAAGSIALLHGDDAVSVTLAAAVPDGFTDWWRPPAGDTNTATIRHLSPAIAGAAALDRDGAWKADPTYGAVWYPNGLLADWAPFRDGRWRWISPAGWTWIDDAEWGFAPAHYGGWVRIDDRWAWAPGPPTGEPAYAAARVAFLGTAGIGLSYAGGIGPAVGWFPLGSGEQTSDTNRHFASIVPRAVFVGGRPVPASLIDLPTWRRDDAPVIVGTLGIPPPAAKPPAPASLVVASARKPPTARHPHLAQRFQIVLNAVARKSTARPHVAGSTAPANPSHNRQHLAANRPAVQ